MIKKNIKVNDHIITYYISNDFKNSIFLVFLHGWGSNSQIWKNLVENLKYNYNILLIDLPGFGFSEKLKYPFQIKNYVDIVNSLLVKLSIRNYFLIGHSFGGSIILKGVHEKIFTPISCILLSSAGIRKKKLIYRIILFLSKIFKKIITNNSIKRFLSNIIGSNEYNEIIDENLKQTFVNVVNDDLTSILKSIKIPVLLIWGSKDKSTPVRHAYLFKKLLYNATLKIMKGNHFFFLNYSEIVSKEIDTWIKNQ